MSAAAAKTSYWVLGEFNDSDAMLKATTTLREEKAGELDTYTAYPVHGIEEALGMPRSKVSWVAFIAGLSGVIAAWGLQLYFNFFSTPHGYAVNVGNKPPHSPPVYVPVTFETMVLFAAFAIVGSLIVYFWGFPRPHHPVFEHEAFKNATTTGWWVSVTVESTETSETVKARLEALGAKNIGIIPEEHES